jgi:hypothetical protein
MKDKLTHSFIELMFNQAFSVRIPAHFKGEVLKPLRDVSSVGSERMLHTHEVTGSNPVRPTN